MKTTKVLPKPFINPFYHLYKANWFFWIFLPLILIIIRSINLLGSPLYLDEGIYIFWAKLFSVDHGYAYVPLTDGKAPLFMWLASSLHSLVGDYLLSGRFVSVISGGVTALSWMIILNLFVNRKAAFFFWLFFLLTPYAFLIERMAFVDSLLTGFISLSTMSILLVFKKGLLQKWWWILFGGFISGLTLGFAYLTKTSARAFFVIILLLGLFFVIKLVWQKKINSIFSVLISTGVMFLVYHEVISDFRIGAQRFWGMIDLKETELTYSLPQIFNTFFISHNFIFTYKDSVPFLSSYLSAYLGILFIPAILGIVWIYKYRKDLLWIPFYFLIAIVGIFLSARMMSSRYFYPVVPVFIAMTGLGAIFLWEKIKYGKIILVIVLVVIFIQSILFIVSPQNAFYAYDDKGFFETGYSTALGLTKIETYLNNTESKSIVGVSGVWGIPDGVETELSDRKIESVTLNNWLGDNNIDINKVAGNQKTDKYLYLTLDEKNALPTLSKFYNYSVIYEFTRPITHAKVYFIKLNQIKEYSK